jgi:hypothetical protein
MSLPRRKSPYWKRSRPHSKFDITKLRPKTLPRRDRFETLHDAKRESARSQSVLDNHRDGGDLGAYLEDCRDDHYECERTYCPICAREFRRYFIGELLRLSQSFENGIKVVVVLLETAPRGELTTLDIAAHRHALRKRLDRAGLEGFPFIGGFEVIYRAKDKIWVLHANLVVFGAPNSALEKLEAGTKAQDAFRPIERAPLEDPAEQLSYILKFTTYHRPLRRAGSQKSPAKPLNPVDHCKLVSWMAQYSFSDFLFLYNARRHGSTIELLTQSDRKA